MCFKSLFQCIYVEYQYIYLDTGTTLILLNTTAYNTYKNVTGAKYDPTIGLLSITHDQFKSLQPLVFNIGGVSRISLTTPLDYIYLFIRVDEFRTGPRRANLASFS